MELRNEIETRQKPEKEGGVTPAVMIFFENSKTLLDFYKCEHMQDMKATTRTITEDIASSDKYVEFLQAFVSGSITLMIREFGRGTDFKCFDSRIIDSGGVHVIQAFFTSDVTEIIQIKVRATHQGTEESYSMVLNANTLEQGPPDIQSYDIVNIRNQYKFYTFLDSRRRDSCALDCIHLTDKVSQAETSHYETVD